MWFEQGGNYMFYVLNGGVKHIWGLDRTHFVYSHVTYNLISQKLHNLNNKEQFSNKERANKWKVPSL